MTLRATIFNTLNVAGLTALAPGGVIGSGDLEGAHPVRPFVVVRVQNTDTILMGDDQAQSHDQIAEVWAYDDHGTYTRIDAVLLKVRELLTASTAMRVRWNGDSVELADDEQKALTRYASFKCRELVSA